jgi:hypothetical protein
MERTYEQKLKDFETCDSKARQSVRAQTLVEFSYMDEYRSKALGLLLSSMATEGGRTSTEPNSSYKRALVAHFLQGSCHVRDIILDGSYAKAAAILKQDMELLCRLEEVKAGTEVENEQPQFRSARYLGRLNGHLNGLAHPSKKALLHIALQTVEDGTTRGISPLPVYKSGFAKSLLGSHAYLCLQAAREGILLLADVVATDQKDFVELKEAWEHLHEEGVSKNVFEEETPGASASSSS